MSRTELSMLALGVCGYFMASVGAYGAVRSGRRESLLFARAFALLSSLQLAGLLFALGIGRGRFPVTGASESFIFLAAVMTIAALSLDGLRRLPIVTVATIPLAFLTTLLALLLEITAPADAPAARGVASIWTGIHVVVALGAYGAFALAFVAGMLYLIEQRQLKNHVVLSALGLMPPLETVNRLNLRSIAVGVPLLTASLLVGYLHARNVYSGESGWRVDPKIILTTLTVLTYATVLALSGRPAFKGRRTAIFSVAGFLLVMATFWASVFWSDFHRFR